MNEQGETVRDLAAKFGVSEHTIRRWAKDLGYKLTRGFNTQRRFSEEEAKLIYGQHNEPWFKNRSKSK